MCVWAPDGKRLVFGMAEIRASRISIGRPADGSSADGAADDERVTCRCPDLCLPMARRSRSSKWHPGDWI